MIQFQLLYCIVLHDISYCDQKVRQMQKSDALLHSQQLYTLVSSHLIMEGRVGKFKGCNILGANEEVKFFQTTIKGCDFFFIHVSLL